MTPMPGAFAMIFLECALTLLAVIVLGVGMANPKRSDGRPEALVATIGFALLFAGTFVGLTPLGEAFGGAWGVGPLSVLYKRLFLAAGALTSLLAYPGGEPNPSIPRSRIGEALGLMTFSVTGMCVLVSSRELALLYTGLELVTMPLVALVAFHPREPRGAEAGLK
jgi:NADH-quinone oxidoreductase subunit N